MSAKEAQDLLKKHRATCRECRKVAKKTSPLCTPATFLTMIAEAK